MTKLKQYDNIVDDLVKIFIEKYFTKDYIFDDDYFWIGSQDEDREVLAVGDYYFNIDRIIDAIRYHCSKKRLFEYYDMEDEYHFKKKEITINFKTYAKYGKIR